MSSSTNSSRTEAPATTASPTSLNNNSNINNNNNNSNNNGNSINNHNNNSNNHQNNNINNATLWHSPGYELVCTRPELWDSIQQKNMHLVLAVDVTCSKGNNSIMSCCKKHVCELILFLLVIHVKVCSQFV